MIVETMSLNNAIIDKNQVINLRDASIRETFINEYVDTTGRRYTGVEAPNFIKNLWKLYNEITIFDESRIPLNVNYMRVRIDDGDWHYFYIYDYEDLGRNQVKYFLKLDTIMTHIFARSNPVINFEDNEQLVLREHKNRFTSTGSPIYDKTLEDVDIKPTVLNLKYQEARSEEHTSELQSRPHLVCRLLLEK